MQDNSTSLNTSIAFLNTPINLVLSAARRQKGREGAVPIGENQKSDISGAHFFLTVAPS